jgi:hemoglobin
MATIYEQLGGEDGMHAAVEIFYERVLSDARLAPFFNGVDMEHQIAKQRAFLTLVLGGPARYSGRELRAAHAPLVARGLAGEHFDAVVEHLGATLRQMGVGDAMIAEVGALVSTTRSDVLGT